MRRKKLKKKHNKLNDLKKKKLNMKVKLHLCNLDATGKILDKSK